MCTVRCALSGDASMNSIDLSACPFSLYTGTALSAATKGKKMLNVLDEEKRQKKLEKLKKPKKQGWFKSDTEARGPVSDSSQGSGSDARSRTSNSLAGNRKSAPAIINADCELVSPSTTGDMPPLEVNISSDMSDSPNFQIPIDDISVLSTSVAFNMHHISPSSVESGSLHSSKKQNKVIDALVSGMDDDRMSDVTLVGKDGAKVCATKFVLACRSPAMQEKLYQDPTQVEVFIGDYGEDAIRAMKEYCHTGAIKGSVLMTKKNGEAARGLVELATLAKVYGFDPLYGEADSILYKLINSSPWFATACYDSAGSKTKLMEESLLQFIKSRCPDLLLETNGLKHMSQQRLTVLLDGIECSDGEMLKYLEKWIELKGATRKNVTFLRATAASKLNLVRLLEDPEMAAHVRSSGIFDRYTVESIINASPIMEEEEEEGGSYDEDGKYVKDDEDDDQLEICPANGSSSMLSLQEPTSATLQIITQMVTESAGNASVSSKEKKKKKKEKKDRDKDKEKKDRDKDKEKKDSDSDKDKDKDKKDKKRKHKRKSSKSRKSSADLLHELERIQEEIEPEQIQEGIEPPLK